ncbi:MAG: hypothetical protein DCC56_05900 [Anaerolineae bacterium]|nr:MAG: hypothetical protein DCC56_05900 [Anaerolineae bacterium]WKZ43612.1 MAG: hypothetical protein QY302_16080 [Anaerolineales bacterium]
MTAMETIAVKVTSQAAKAFRSASDAERRKIELLLSLRLLDVAESSQSLEDVMRQISKSAQARGLTEEMWKEFF